MNKLLSFVLGLVLVLGGAVGFASQADAAVYVRGYTRSNGTYVMPHYRSNPNSYRYDNYSTKGNYNPYTGKAGARSYYRY